MIKISGLIGNANSTLVPLIYIVNKPVHVIDKVIFNRTASGFLPKYRRMLIELVAVRREALQKMRDEKLYSDELLNNRE